MDDKRLSYRIYKLAQPMAPGESRLYEIHGPSHVHGIENDVSHLDLVENGTFFNNFVAPQIGYQSAGELTDKNDRKKYGLKKRTICRRSNAIATSTAATPICRTTPIG